ncbi:MarR family winged helix-turn-helix transcriptional regulator [Alicyclobacillus fastidiosus]|uniref:MarR family transcriptional regulator n=1 Tax=Alicyclobacillus fastidiosus TaxID=392011 RepID=A0ABV5A9U3_9BACL|nr:MarR family transcriptional regulator [Alicyclobacillus fastidiosus]WEH10784.1 MarR family transcriptional regulator [Alicyclobacillus fastidiosus]
MDTTNDLMNGRQRAGVLIDSFRQVNRSMDRLWRHQAESLGLTLVQLMVLRSLTDDSDLSLGALAESCQIGCSTMSGVVKRLVESGAVERHRLEDDQRTIAIRLTPKGMELKNQAFGEESCMRNAFLRFLDLSDNDIDAMLALHQKLIEVLNRE